MDRGINFYNCRQLMLLGTSVFSVAAVMVSPVYGQDAVITKSKLGFNAENPGHQIWTWPASKEIIK
jgi:hypothetical protein